MPVYYDKPHSEFETLYECYVDKEGMAEYEKAAIRDAVEEDSAMKKDAINYLQGRHVRKKHKEQIERPKLLRAVEQVAWKLYQEDAHETSSPLLNFEEI